MSPLSSTTTALIADDEPLLRKALQRELAQAWPELQVVAAVGNGMEAVEVALRLRPQVLFLDIRMPGLSGLEVAAELSDLWPGDQTFPQLVFVTAYDEYATQAFEAEALDYLLKPVQPERLARTVARLQARLPDSALRVLGGASDHLLAQLREALGQSESPARVPSTPLTVIQANVGNTLHLVPLADVRVLEAADKYVRVLTQDREYLIRTPLKELLPRLSGEAFWQIHRGTVVQATHIQQVTRDEAGRLNVHLRDRQDTWPVSRLYAYRFKAM